MPTRTPRLKNPSVRDLRRTLIDGCTQDAGSIVRQGLATQVDVDALRPGGAKNPDLSIWGWIYFGKQLVRYHALGEVRDGRLRRPDELATPGSGRQDVGESELLEMLGESAERVELVTPIDVDGGTMRSVSVFPKSMGALTQLTALDHDARWLVARMACLEQRIVEGDAAAADLELMHRCADRLLQLQGRLLWIVTSPSPRSPWDPHVTPDPELPASWYLALDPIDVARILITHQRVNGARLQVLDRLLPRGASDRKPSTWATFIASTSREIHADPVMLIHEWSLQKVVATASLAARARLDAEAEAKAQADREGRKRA